MRIGLLSDAHGNYLGLSLCLRALKKLGVDAVYFLGDAGGYLPGECEVLRILATNPVFCQLGNHDAMLLGRLPLPGERDTIYRLHDARARISRPQWKFLESWPEQRIERLGNRTALLVHGSPAESLKGYVYPDSDCSMFEHLPYNVIFMGNTHYPFVKNLGEMLIVNVGSCGLPRDQGDAPAFAVYESETNQAEIFRIRLDPQVVLNEFSLQEPAEETKKCLFRSATKPIVGKFLEVLSG